MAFPLLPTFLKTGVLLPSGPDYCETAYTRDKNNKDDKIVHGCACLGHKNGTPHHREVSPHEPQW
eukprot:92142-Prorocentrum_lima.AAC.1